MKPFRASLTARLVSVSITLAVGGGGLVLTLGISPNSIPLVLLAAIGFSIVGLIVGVEEHPEPVLLLGVVLPLALLPYVMLLELIRTGFPEYAWILVAAGIPPLALTLLAPATIAPQQERARVPAK